jgi:hypothetical protein
VDPGKLSTVSLRQHQSHEGHSKFPKRIVSESRSIFALRGRMLAQQLGKVPRQTLEPSDRGLRGRAVASLISKHGIGRDAELLGNR